MNGQKDARNQAGMDAQLGGIGGQATTRELKSQQLFATLMVVQEVRDRLYELKAKVGSNERPAEVSDKAQPAADIDPTNLVMVVDHLRGEIEQVCSHMITMINEMGEDLL